MSSQPRIKWKRLYDRLLQERNLMAYGEKSTEDPKDELQYRHKREAFDKALDILKEIHPQ